MIPELTAIAISFTSLHIPYNGENYINPGIHLEAENYRAGLYRNSNRDPSESSYTGYVGYTVPLGGTDIGGIKLRAGLLAALDYGYRSPIVGGLELRVGARVVVLATPQAYGFAYRIPLEK